MLVEWTSDTGGVTSGVNTYSTIASVPLLTTMVITANCFANPNEEATGGGGGALDTVSASVMRLHSSFKSGTQQWQVSVENTDPVNPHNALAEVICVPTT